MFTHAFAYGSLLDPTSLSSTLPGVDLGELEPAWLRGFSRNFGVAFPNDGSQGDKAYLDEAGRRPPFVLFANVVAGAGDASQVNGVLVPMGDGELERLRQRELRYGLVDVTDAVRFRSALPTHSQGRVGVFVGRPAFTRPEDVARGVVAAAYRRRIERGVAFWEARWPGFLRGYSDSTDSDPTLAVVELRRVDSGANNVAR